LGDREPALDAVQDWPDQYVSINFSPRQFRHEEFAETLIAQVAGKAA
jgi:EAL domain-containing protein (putative c-di-GMP-specific phosphodiesterase class I)